MLLPIVVCEIKLHLAKPGKLAVSHCVPEVGSILVDMKAFKHLVKKVWVQNSLGVPDKVHHLVKLGLS